MKNETVLNKIHRGKSYIPMFSSTYAFDINRDNTAIKMINCIKLCGFIIEKFLSKNTTEKKQRLRNKNGGIQIDSYSGCHFFYVE